MQLSRALSDLVKYTKSVGSHDVDTEGEGRPGLGVGGVGGGRPGCNLQRLSRRPPAPSVASSWQVSSFSETRAQQILQQKPAQYLRFNQHQLSRIYPSSYRVDSSNYNPQPFWSAGCQLGGCASVRGGTASAPQHPAGSPVLWGPAWHPADFTRLALGWDPQSPGCVEVGQALGDFL